MKEKAAPTVRQEDARKLDKAQAACSHPALQKSWKLPCHPWAAQYGQPNWCPGTSGACLCHKKKKSPSGDHTRTQYILVPALIGKQSSSPALQQGAGLISTNIWMWAKEPVPAGTLYAQAAFRILPTMQAPFLFTWSCYTAGSQRYSSSLF
jgi:hypothetical protein